MPSCKPYHTRNGNNEFNSLHWDVHALVVYYDHSPMRYGFTFNCVDQQWASRKGLFEKMLRSFRTLKK